MKHNENVMTSNFSMRWIADPLVMATLVFLLSITPALAREIQNPVAENDPAQPTVPATATSESEKAMTQTLDSYKAGNSTDFLMGASPLSAGAATETAPSVMVPEPPPIRNASPAPVTLEVLKGTVLREPEEVAILVSEQCSQGGNASEGTNSCTRVYSNGHHAIVLTQNGNEGDELKSQTVVKEFDGDNTLLFKKTIRHRVDYNYLNDQKKTKEKEFFDITYQVAGKKTTRELMVYEYFLDTGKAKSLSWTQYRQIASKPKAELAYHASLRYGDDGNPDRGIAERWEQGKKAETFMNWNRQSKGFATLDDETWGQWEGWIRNVSLQAYLP